MVGELVSTETVDGVRLDGFWVRGSSDDCWLVTHGVNGNFYGSSLLKEFAQTLSFTGSHVLLVNSRGHDIVSFNSGSVPMRLGSQYEMIYQSLSDLNAWESFCREHGIRLLGIGAHSLGALKTAYWLSESLGVGVERYISLSPPRLSTSILAEDPKRGEVFCKDLQLAKELCESGKSDQVIRVRYPLPNWLSAATFLDKYGSNDRYDYFGWLEKISQQTLWVFGESEVRNGSGNFRDADLNLSHRFAEKSLYHHSVEVIEGGDHSYRGVRQPLWQTITSWLTRSL
ncbi:hypothetical protein VN12_07695 [Pirellula sp. SH-Sr6A]|uniref:alpha/beta hydrolase n=1 Tax=Pirellula sp. SH-Sr6A TaxID=1632865 RepID=UPI00078B9C3B|nr:alpha/beta hydrolase [Pirellula sp. SH-Sr6A]AMV31989.1 hypothetical protein VN12_07695 [Pirellula sp. SH-Sr6A]